MFFDKRYKTEKENRMTLCALANTDTPWLAYTRLRAFYLTKCHNYPYHKASEVAEAEWNRLEDMYIKGGI